MVAAIRAKPATMDTHVGGFYMKILVKVDAITVDLPAP